MKPRAVMLLLIGCLLTAGTSAHQPASTTPTQFYPLPGSDAAALPFSDAVVTNGLIFLSGKIGNIPGGRELAAGGIQGQTRQAMENIKSTLERLGSDMNRVVKCTVFLADMAEWAAMNAVYITYFPQHKPARSAVAVNGLALNARVEIECIAAR